MIDEKPLQPTSSGVSKQRLVATVNSWRDHLNPLRSLTPSRAAALLEANQRGVVSDLQWLFYAMERRSAVLRSLVKRRRAALSKLTWSIVPVEEIPSGATQAMVDDQVATLKGAYDAIGNVTEALRFLALAEFRGYSILQKHRSTDGDIIHLEPLDHWNWARQGFKGSWAWNPRANAVDARGLPAEAVIDPAEFLIREVDMPIDEVALGHFVRFNLGIKDWTGYLEIYGIPGAVVIGPENVPNDKMADYQASAEAIAQGGSGSLPNGSQVVYPQPPRNRDPFKEFLDWLKEEIVLAGTGGKLTMLSDSTGIGQGASDEHGDTWQEIAEDEAAAISEIFQEQIDVEILERHHSGQPVLAYWKLAAKDQIDVTAVIQNVKTLADAGYEVDPTQVEELTGYKVVKKEPIPMTPAPGKAPVPLANRRWALSNRAATDYVAQQKLVDRVVEDVAGVSVRYLNPVREVFQQLIAKAETAEVSDNDLVAAMERAAERMPELFGELDVDLLATALEKAMGAAVVNGAVARQTRFQQEVSK